MSSKIEIGIHRLGMRVLAWLAVRSWLKGFACRTDIGIGIFVLSGLAAFTIALITVSFQSARAARTNPAATLRYE